MVKAYDWETIATGVVVDDADEASYTESFFVGGWVELLLAYDVTDAFTGGASPGLKFTFQVNIDGDVTSAGAWVAASTLMTTTIGYTANGPTDPTVTATGAAYRLYAQMFGIYGRVKVEVTGTPTGGTATYTIRALKKQQT